MGAYIDYAGRATAILFGLVLAGCSFFLWRRSKTAALAGAGAGAATVFTEIAMLVLSVAASRDASAAGHEVLLVWMATSGLQGLLQFGLMSAMALSLGRGDEAR